MKNVMIVMGLLFAGCAQAIQPPVYLCQQIVTDRGPGILCAPVQLSDDGDAR